MSRLLLDTNVLIDLVDERRPQSQDAALVIERCNGGGDMGLVTPMSLKDAYYVLGRAYGERIARRCVDLLVSLLVVAPFGAEECDLALRSDEPDFEDGLIRACAELNGVDVILSRDVRAFEGSKVPVMTCAEYLEKVGER
jgi:predicted nucleic acid-binding protein